MAVCMFWLLTYVGQGLDLAVGNRPMIITPDTQGLEYRHGSNSIRKKSEPSSIGGNLLHFRIYSSDGPHRDDLSNWLVFDDEPRISSWSPAGMLIDDIVKEPRELQSAFFALSPAVLNVLYSDHVTSQSHGGVANAEHLVHDDGNLLDGRQQQQHHQQQQLQMQQHQRAKKRRAGCRHPRGPLSLPILVCDGAGRKATFQETRQSNQPDDLYEQRLDTATNTKTDLARAEGGVHRELPNGGNGGFISRALVYETGKLPGKRNQIMVGRRSVDAQDESSAHQAQASSGSPVSAGPSLASQLMLRSIRGSIQYDVPQIGKSYNTPSSRLYSSRNTRKVVELNRRL